MLFYDVWCSDTNNQPCKVVVNDCDAGGPMLLSEMSPGDRLEAIQDIIDSDLKIYGILNERVK